MAIGLKGLWANRRRISQVEASEGNIMHDDLTANGPHVQYCASHDIIFVGEGSNPAENRLMRLASTKRQIYFGSSEAVQYRFPENRGTNGQGLTLNGDTGTLTWSDMGAGENLGTHDLTLTDNRRLYFDGSWLVFKDTEEGSDPVLSLNALTMTIGGEETGWDLILGRAGFEGMCLTEVVADGQSAWRYPWNPFNKTPEEGEGNIAMGVGVMSTFDGDTGDNSVVIGNGDAGSGITTASECIYIGKDAGDGLTGGDNIIVGSGSTGAATNTPLVMIGNGATASGDGQFHVGSAAHPVVNATAIGGGITEDTRVSFWLDGVEYWFICQAAT